MSETLVLKVDGMSCSACAAAVERAIRAQVPAAAVEVDLDHGEVRVEAPRLDRGALAAAITSAGYDVAA